MFDRIKKMMGAMVTSGVNKLETPEVLLEQAESELKDNTKKLKESWTESVVQEKMFEKQIQKNQEELTTWEKRATLAVQHNNDEVATECLKKKQEHSQNAQNLNQQLEQQKTLTTTLKGKYQEVEHKLQEFLNKKSDMLARAKAGDSLVKAHELTSGTTENSMDKWEAKIREKELQADPLQTAALDSKFKQLDQHNELDAELAALKAQIGTPQSSSNSVPLIVEVKTPKDADADSAADK
jgi:phage shock protein A